MQYGKFKLIDGIWVAQDNHSAAAPTGWGITPGQPCGGSIRNPTHLTLQEKLRQRWFDKPSEAQIKALEQEDAPKSNAEEVVREAKQDLQSGKMRVSPEVIQGGRIIPFGHVTDERGITHIVPQDQAKKYSAEEFQRMQTNAAKEIEERYNKTEVKVEGETQSIGRPIPASPHLDKK